MTSYTSKLRLFGVGCSDPSGNGRVRNSVAVMKALRKYTGCTLKAAKKEIDRITYDPTSVLLDSNGEQFIARNEDHNLDTFVADLKAVNVEVQKLPILEKEDD